MDVHQLVRLNLGTFVMGRFQYHFAFLFLYLTIAGMEFSKTMRNVMMEMKIQMMDVVQVAYLKKAFIVMRKVNVRLNVEMASLLVLKFVIQENIDLVLLIV